MVFSQGHQFEFSLSLFVDFVTDWLLDLLDSDVELKDFIVAQIKCCTIKN